MTTHVFDLSRDPSPLHFSPGSHSVKAGDDVTVKNTTSFTAEVGFPECFADTSDYNLVAGEEVTRTISSALEVTSPPTTYALQARVEASATPVNTIGIETPEESVGDIIVIAD